MVTSINYLGEVALNYQGAASKGTRHNIYRIHYIICTTSKETNLGVVSIV